MKTTEQAFKELHKSLSQLSYEIRKSIPDLGHKTIYALYTISIFIFYGLSIFLITEGHYLDAIAYSLAGLYLTWRR